MDSIRVSEAPDTGSIPVEATKAALSKEKEVRLFLLKAMSRKNRRKRKTKC
jgi:putative endonuclease